MGQLLLLMLMMINDEACGLQRNDVHLSGEGVSTKLAPVNSMFPKCPQDVLTGVLVTVRDGWN